MKMQIVGLEGSSGIGNKSGKPYDIGQVHTIVALAPPFGENNVAKGFMGSMYECSSAIIRSVAHNPVPFNAEVEVRDIMKFGKRETHIISITPEKIVSAPIK
jgi:lactam utilization protein B